MYKVEFSKNNLLIIQQVKVPQKAVEKQYSELVGCQTMVILDPNGRTLILWVWTFNFFLDLANHKVDEALTRLTWLIHKSFLPSKWNLYLKIQYLA